MDTKKPTTKKKSTPSEGNSKFPPWTIQTVKHEILLGSERHDQRSRHYFIEATDQRDPNNIRWAIRDDLRNVLGRDLEWEYEPFPSSRTDEFLARTRYNFSEAVDVVRDWIEKEFGEKEVRPIDEVASCLEKPQSPSSS